MAPQNTFTLQIHNNYEVRVILSTHQVMENEIYDTKYFLEIFRTS